MKKLITMAVILTLSIGINFANTNLSKPNYLKQLDLSSITKPEKEVEDVIPGSIVNETKKETCVKTKIQHFFQKHFKASESHTISGLVYMYFVKDEDQSFIVVASDEPILKKYVETKLTIIEEEVIELFAENNLSSVSIYFKQMN